jgi:hypothetical protein
MAERKTTPRQKQISTERQTNRQGFLSEAIVAGLASLLARMRTVDWIGGSLALPKAWLELLVLASEGMAAAWFRVLAGVLLLRPGALRALERKDEAGFVLGLRV